MAPGRKAVPGRKPPAVTLAEAMDESFNPTEEQNQEMMVLESILMDEFKELPSEQLNAHRRRRRCALTILPHPSEGPNYVQVLLDVTLEPTYPILMPHVCVENAPAATHNLSAEALAELSAALRQVSKDNAGSVHLMALAEAAREFLCARNVPEPKPISAHEQMTRRQKQEAPRLSMSVLSPVLSHQASPKYTGGRGGAGDLLDGFRLEDVEAELDVNLQAVQRKHKQNTRRLRKARGAGDAPAADDAPGAESSDDEAPPNLTPSRSLARAGAPPKLAPRALLPRPAARGMAVSLGGAPAGAAPGAGSALGKKPSQASAFAEAAVGAGRKMWGSVRELLSGSGAAWSQRGEEGDSNDEFSASSRQQVRTENL